jgi:hypothetical protein
VQVGHAVLAAANTFGNPNVTHPHLIVCAVEGERALTDAFESLKEQGVPCCAYYEPDFQDAITAIATAPLRGDARKPLRPFRLL